MAITATEKFSAGIGGKQFRIYDLTFDGTLNVLGASVLGLHYIEAVMMSPPYLTTDPANLSAYIHQCAISITTCVTVNDALFWTNAPDKTGSKARIMAFGW